MALDSALCALHFFIIAKLIISLTSLVDSVDYIYYYEMQHMVIKLREREREKGMKKEKAREKEQKKRQKERRRNRRCEK